MPRRATSKIKPDQNPIGLIGDAQFLAKISVMLLVIHAIKWQTSCPENVEVFAGSAGRM
jgi:hypothetical protein